MCGGHTMHDETGFEASLIDWLMCKQGLSLEEACDKLALQESARAALREETRQMEIEPADK